MLGGGGKGSFSKKLKLKITPVSRNILAEQAGKKDYWINIFSSGNFVFILIFNKFELFELNMWYLLQTVAITTERVDNLNCYIYRQNYTLPYHNVHPEDSCLVLQESDLLRSIFHPCLPRHRKWCYGHKYPAYLLCFPQQWQNLIQLVPINKQKINAWVVIWFTFI